MPELLGARYLGAGLLDQSSAAALLESAFGDRDDWASRPVAPLLASLLKAFETGAPPEPAEPGGSIALASETLISARGNCLAPIVNDDDLVEIDPTKSVRPGDLATVVTRLGFLGKIALYLGRLHRPETGDLYGSRVPGYLEIFYQREPECEICVADFDLIGAWRIVKIRSGEQERPAPPRWPFPELQQYAAIRSLSPTPIPVPTMSMKTALVREVVGFCARLEELKKEGTT